MVLSAEIRNRRERQRIGELADAWRRLASATPPWKAVEVAGGAVLLDTRQESRLGTLQGQWTPGVTRYLNALNPYAGLTLAELLWNIGGHGTATAARVKIFEAGWLGIH